MAQTAAVISRDEEEIQNSSEDEDRFLTPDAVTASPGCSASPSLDTLNGDKRSSAGPERLSVLSSRAVAQGKALAGPGMVSAGQAQRTAPGLAECPLAAADASLGVSSYPVVADDLLPEEIASLPTTSPPCDGELSSDVLQAPKVTGEASEALQAGTGPGDGHMQQAGTSSKGNTVSCSLGHVIWMKTTKVMETLENKKKEEKEKYRLQLSMYRRLLLLRSIRSLHRQLEQQQARLQECYGTVIETKKEVLKQICSTSPSPSP